MKSAKRNLPINVHVDVSKIHNKRIFMRHNADDKNKKPSWGAATRNNSKNNNERPIEAGEEQIQSQVAN